MSKPVTPLLTVDLIIEMTDRPGRPIVLIERRHPPHGRALPGGFVDVGESLENAAIREAREETSLDVRLKLLLGNYSDPGRDFRGHTVSAVYIAEAQGEPVAADDASNLELVNPRELPPLVFDHPVILADYLAYLETGKLTPLRQ
ncbi:MAG: NUDIX hydrolase [Gammaproteobacteria bacterium]|nr:NUDIX hydrolase [Gammaproteobacteria bacterium]